MTRSAALRFELSNGFRVQPMSHQRPCDQVLGHKSCVGAIPEFVARPIRSVFDPPPSACRRRHAAAVAFFSRLVDVERR